MVSNLDNFIQPKQKKLETPVEKRSMKLAASWYIAMESKELGKQPQAIKLFGQPLVAWRDSTAHPVIMERFCSHMGASLAIGKVVDNCIQCHFHHWLYDSSGQCVHIPPVAAPKVDQIPPTARQTIYVTVERYGYIWVWYGSKTPLFPLPEFPSAESQKHEYIPFRFSLPTKTSVRRIIENIFDHNHVVTVHQQDVIEPIQLTLLNDQDVELSKQPIQKEAWLGAIMEARLKGYFGIGVVARALGLNPEIVTGRIEAWPSGSISTSYFNGQERFRVLGSVTPIAENNTTWQLLITIKKTGNFWQDVLSYLVFGVKRKASVKLDIPIFNTMSADEGRAFTKIDRGVLKFREFYQYWVNKAE